MTTRLQIMSFGLILGVLLLGVWIPNQFGSQKIYVYVGGQRVPASIDQGLNFVRLDGRDLKIASERQLSQAAQLNSDPQGFSIQLGNYALNAPDGQAALSCQLHDRIEVVFRAIGVAHSGQVPKMILHGTCRLSPDFSQIQPLYVPIAEIFNTPQLADEYTFMSTPDPITLRFESLGGTLPSEWEVYSFRHYKTGEYHQGIVIEWESLLRYRAQPLKLMWSQKVAYQEL